MLRFTWFRQLVAKSSHSWPLVIILTVPGIVVTGCCLTSIRNRKGYLIVMWSLPSIIYCQHRHWLKPGDTSGQGIRSHGLPQFAAWAPEELTHLSVNIRLKAIPLSLYRFNDKLLHEYMSINPLTCVCDSNKFVMNTVDFCINFIHKRSFYAYIWHCWLKTIGIINRCS